MTPANKEPKMVESTSPALILSRDELRKIYFLIRARQDDCRKVTEEYSGYATLHEIDLELSVLNEKVARQINILPSN